MRRQHWRRATGRETSARVARAWQATMFAPLGGMPPTADAEGRILCPRCGEALPLHTPACHPAPDYPTGEEG